MLATGINEILADYVYFSDVDALRDVAENLVESESDIKYVLISDHVGRILASSKGEYSEGLDNAGSEVRPISEIPTEVSFNSDTLELAGPILADTEPIGVFQVAFSSTALDEEIRQVIYGHIWQGLILLGMGVVLAYALTRIAVRPLKELASAAREIGQGNLKTPMPTGRLKETAELGAALEGMRTDLQRIYSGLETEVHRRTEELSTANEQLSQAQDRLYTVINNAPVALFALDKDGLYTLSEGRALELLGRVPGQFVGQSVFEVYHDVPAIWGGGSRCPSRQ